MKQRTHNHQYILDAIDVIGLAGIALYCLCASVFVSDFAELHIQLSFLNFPIFISEILLGIVFILFVAKRCIEGTLPSSYKIWVLYLGWIMLCAGIGYWHYQGLALRNAALFYYVLCALFAYEFYNPRLLKNRKNLALLAACLICLIVLKWYSSYFWYTYAVLTTVLLWQLFPKNKWWVVLGVLLGSHVESLFMGSRSHLIGVIGALVFVAITCGRLFSQKSIRVWLIGFVCVFLFCVGLIKFADPNALKSLVGWQRITQIYKEKHAYILERRANYKPRTLGFKVYNENQTSFKEELGASTRHLKEELFKHRTKPKAMPTQQSEPVKANAASQASTIGHDQPIEQVNSTEIAPHPTDQAPAGANIQLGQADQSPRDINIAYNNILFRVFIWQDMIDELNKKGWVTGVGFGQPQRSESLEILEWAISEWYRDGWVAPHNSFLHMVYRAGIVGIAVVVLLVLVLVRLTRYFMKGKNLTGLMLVSVIIYWSLLSLMDVILELPYNAILFWSLLGLIYAYAFKEKHP